MHKDFAVNHGSLWIFTSNALLLLVFLRKFRYDAKTKVLSLGKESVNLFFRAIGMITKSNNEYATL